VSATICGRTRRLLPFHLEHETEPAQALETAQHLLRCDDCAVEASRGRAMTMALRALPLPAPPRDLAPEIMSRLRRLKKGAPATSAAKWSAVGLLLALLLLRGLLPSPAWRTGLRALARLGELIDLDFLVDRLMDAFSRLLPSPSTFFDGLAGAGFASGQISAATSPRHALIILLSMTTLAIVSGLVVTGVIILTNPGRKLGERVLRLF